MVPISERVLSLLLTAHPSIAELSNAGASTNEMRSVANVLFRALLKGMCSIGRLRVVSRQMDSAFSREMGVAMKVPMVSVGLISTACYEGCGF